jgi:hypothetical protein
MNRRYALTHLTLVSNALTFPAGIWTCLHDCSMKSRLSWEQSDCRSEYAPLREIVEQIAEVAFEQARCGRPDA